MSKGMIGVTSPKDMVLRVPSPSLEERSFIISEQKRRGVSVEHLFLAWMKEAFAADKAGKVAS